MDALRNAAHGAFKKAAEAVLPPLTKSQFEEKRVRRPLPPRGCVPPPPDVDAHLPSLHPSLQPLQVLTPDEFVRAGDYLVRACPTWSW
jgi:ubiquitin-like-conjugating enzyme ATG3